jgi:hypothetical protein
MANPTTNYGFVMPSPTDLVTDLPADFDVFGQAVDTQMLTNANAAIAKTIVDAKGDLIAATAADTVSRLAVGTNGHVLTADSTEATGIKWAAAAGGGAMVKITSASFSAVSSVSFAADTFTATYKDYLVIISITSTSADMTIQGRMRASGADSTAGNYFSLVQQWDTGAGTASSIANANQTIMSLGYANSGGDIFGGAYTFIAPQLASVTKIQGEGTGLSSGFNLVTSRSAGHLFNAATQFDSFSFIASTGNFTGRYAVYGLEA